MKEMEHNHHTLKEAIAGLAQHEPEEKVWRSIDAKLNELPLHHALSHLPEYEPDALLWDIISRKSGRQHDRIVWWRYAAAVVLIGGGGWLFWFQNHQTEFAYTQENIDVRLQTGDTDLTHKHYQRLKAYCETETMVCNSKNYKELQKEYEKLHSAGQQLQNAIGEFNTEPELVRQYNNVEQQKAAILNEMAKMI
jgi:hypothetical protein